MARICIICEKEPSGAAHPVGDDIVVSTIRAAKQRLGVAKNNELTVCEGCMPQYREKRKKFERNMVFYMAIGVLIFVVINGLQLFSGKFSLVTFVASIFLALVIGLLAIMNYEIPPLKDDASRMKETQSAPQASPQAPAQERRTQAKKPAAKSRRK